MAHPFLLEDESALYAQGEGLLVRIDREDLERTSDENALRARAGSTVTLSTGATFLLGGLAEDDTPLDRWQVFMPTLGSD
jgi:hypothetical protein